jgi:DNA-3-methyladenine glycosylase
MRPPSRSTPWEDPWPLDRLIGESRLLPRAFYEKATVEVARGLLGAVLVHGPAAGRIVEVEAYLGYEDKAAHASRGITPRTKVLFGPPGHAYVYFIYGKYFCLNVVAEPDGRPGCVLIRALAPLAGVEAMRCRRPAAGRIEELAAGPARLTMAMNIDGGLNGADLTGGPLTLRELRDPPAVQISTSGRIGIRHCADWPLRFYLSGNPCVSRG